MRLIYLKMICLVFPWIPYLEKLLAGGGGVLSDTEFMAIKTFEGKMLFNTGDPGAVEDLGAISFNAITPANGKTFYHYLSTASVISGVAPDFVLCIIRNNGTNQDNIGFDRTTGGIVEKNESRIASELIGDGIKEFDQLVSWAGTSGSDNYNFTLQGWIEDTGTSPQVPAI